MGKRLLTVSICFSACTAQSSWEINTISTGDTVFDSSRLRFCFSNSPLSIEFVKFADHTDIFLNLSYFRFSQSLLPISFIIEENLLEEPVSVYEGRMRIKISEQMSNRLIQALQIGKKIDILVDGFHERLDPDQFPAAYSRFLEGRQMNFLRGPIE